MILIGTAGWSIPRAAAERFPGEGPHLARYSRVFSCAEIDSSFHRPLRRALYAKWAALTPHRFRFSVKLPRVITHEARLRGARSLLESFLSEVGGLGGKLGPLLVQLPPSLAFETRAARAFFRLLRERHRGAAVCEPRHASWLEGRADAVLVAYGIGRVAADPAGVPEAGTPGGYLGPAGDGRGAVAYYRLHGAPRKYWDRYPAARVASFSAACRAWPRGAEVWCIFDNTAAGGAIENALEMKDMLGIGRARAFL